MTQERNQPGQSPNPDETFPSSTQVPNAGNPNPDPVREPWDPRREPQGAPMPWEQTDKERPTTDTPSATDTGMQEK
jgi:hypothetical protein